MKLRRVLLPLLPLALAAAALTWVPASAADSQAVSGPQAGRLIRTVSGVAPVRPGSVPKTRPYIAAAPAIVAPAAVSPAVTAPKVSAGSPIPLSFARGITVDDTDGYVFVYGDARLSLGLVVTDLAGHLVTTLEPTHTIGGLTLDRDTHTLFVALNDLNEIQVVNVSTLTDLKTLAVTGGAGGMGYYDGALWLGGTFDDTNSLRSVDVATGTVTTFETPDFEASSVKSVPHHPGLLAVSDVSVKAVRLIDVSSGSLVYGATLDGTGMPVTLTPDGTHVAFADNLYTIPDLAADGTYYDFTWHGAISDTSSVDAENYQDQNVPNINIYRFGATVATRSYFMARDIDTAGFSPDGNTLYIVSTSTTALTDSLAVITGVDTAVSTITVTTPHHAALGKTVTPTGSLSFQGLPADGKTRTIHVTRTDNAGVHALADVATDSSGNFTIKDTAAPLGQAKYTVTYDGDAARSPATASASTLREIPWDINDDGYADLVVGSPGEDIGSVADAGDFTVLYGHASGVTGTASVEYDQDQIGIPGTVEPGDLFGYSSATGDFNGDGYPDVAVSAPHEDSGSAVDGGGVWIFYGGASGLRTDNVQMITMATTSDGDGSRSSDASLGESLTSGDFNGDGMDDLAAGMAGRNEVLVAYGTDTGLNLSKTSMNTLSAGNAGVPAAYSTFGASLSAGDINGDGFADLAIGSPYDYLDKQYSTGSVEVVYGNATSLRIVKGSQRYTPDTSGVPGSTHLFAKDAPDSFGWQVELADFNGDGKADLAVSAPGTPVTTSGVKHEDAGTVTILYSTGTKLSATGSVEITQSTSGVPGSPGKNDLFGSTMATGDTNNDGKADLAIYSPGDHYVTVAKGASGGISFSTSTGWTQSSAGIPGTDESGDYWGDSLRFAAFKGAGHVGLAVGADGENSDEGSVTLIYSTSSGLTGTGSTAFSQDSSGVPGTSEKGDEFGSFYGI